MTFVASDAVKAVIRNLDVILKDNPQLKSIVEVLMPSIYIVGGFIRDSYLGNRVRDIDFMVDVDDKRLRDVVNNFRCLYAINRHGGIKIYSGSSVVDIWSFDNNWAFKSNSVSYRDDSKLNSIAQGCFYNYDSLVIRLIDLRYNFKYFEDFCLTNKLDILKDNNYQARNPMQEANILRAFYVREKYKSDFSDKVKRYIFEEIVNIDLKGDVWANLKNTQEQYYKYSNLDIEKIKREIQVIIREMLSINPYIFDISHLLY